MPEYEILTEWGQLLVDNRHLFLSKQVYKSYGGYALGQARDLNRRANEGKTGFSSDTINRTPKHARHCFRLLWQGRELLETGNLTLRVTPEQREQLFELGQLPVNELVNAFEVEFAEFDKIVTTLPDAPDVDGINKLLLAIRKGN